MEALKQRLKDPDLLKTQLFVGGQWVDAASGETVDVRLTRCQPVNFACMYHCMLAAMTHASFTDTASLHNIAYKHWQSLAAMPSHSL